MDQPSLVKEVVSVYLTKPKTSRQASEICSKRSFISHHVVHECTHELEFVRVCGQPWAENLHELQNHDSATIESGIIVLENINSHRKSRNV